MPISALEFHALKRWDRKHLVDLRQSFLRAAEHAICAMREGRPDEPVWAFPEAPWPAHQVISTFKLDHFLRGDHDRHDL